jgi:flavin-binding protein dodecin
MSAVKVIKILGTSEESWEDAAEEAVLEANETIDGIRGVEVESWTAKVEDDQVVEYRATVEIAFPVAEQAR